MDTSKQGKLPKKVLMLLVLLGGISGNFLNDIKDMNKAEIMSYRATVRDISSKEPSKKTCRVKMVKQKMTDIDKKKTMVKAEFYFTVFLRDDAFSDAFHIFFSIDLEESTKRLDKSLKVRFSKGLVGEDTLQHYDIEDAVITSSDFHSNFDFDHSSFITISSNFGTGSKKTFKVDLKERISFKFLYIFYMVLVSSLSLVQFVASVVICHKGIHEKLSFVRKLPLIPSVQSWATDFVLILTIWRYFEVYYLICEIQIFLGFVGIPLLLAYFANDNLFVGREKAKKHVVLGFLGLFVLLSNLMVLEIYGNKMSYLCVMLMMSFILEGVVFNKRHQHLWFFWMYMIPKTLIILYIFYWPYNLVLNPIDIKELTIIVSVGVFLYGIILVQKYWSPRFGFMTDAERRLMKRVPKVMSIEEALSSNNEKRRNLLDDFCAICWMNFSHKDVEEKICSKSKEENKRSDILMETGCGHVFHKECLEAWIKKKSKCPTCRGRIYQLR